MEIKETADRKENMPEWYINNIEQLSETALKQD